EDIACERLLKLLRAARRERGAIGRLPAIESLAETAHPLWHREVANPHLAQVVVEILAECVEELLPKAVADPLLAITLRLGAVTLPFQPVQEQHEMKHNEVKPALNGVRHAVASVKRRIARLRHDHAIERANDALLGITPKWRQYHRVNPYSRQRRRVVASGGLSILRFGRRAEAGWT